MRHRFSSVTSIVTFIALLLGNLVVATNAGDACGTGYPKCNGYWIPPLNNPLVVIEYSHRLFTGGLGFLILINFYVSWRRKFVNEKAVMILAPLSALLLFVQALVGGVNVLLDTPPGFTTIDVTISLALLSSLVLLTTALQRQENSTLDYKTLKPYNKLRKLSRPSIVMFVLFYIEVVIGAFFKHSGASKTLFGIPYTERLIGSIQLSDLLYNIHGVFTFVVLISAFWLLFHSIKAQALIVSSSLLLSFILLNGIIGFITVLTNVFVISSSIHMIVASATIGIGAYCVGRTTFGNEFILKSRE